MPLKNSVFMFLLVVALNCNPSSTDTATEGAPSPATNTTGGNETTEPTPTSETPQNSTAPKVGTISVGGLPAESETASLKTFAIGDAQVGAQELSAVGSSLQLNISKQNSEAISLQLSQDGDECEESFFCFAKAFIDIYEMVTGPAECNFNLLLGDDKFEVNQIEGQQIFYVEGWGAIGLGDNGEPTCPTRDAVSAWVQSVANSPSSALRLNEDDEEYYLPVRLVMFKNTEEQKINWRIVFFPSDQIESLAQKITHFKNFTANTLDFVMYHGVHDFSSSIGNGVGDITLDFDELGRMVNMLSDDEESSSGGMPQGKIHIAYDFDNDIEILKTTFLDQFSFGDDAESPFETGKITTIMKKSGENYLHFFSGKPFLSGEDSEETDPFHTVQFCEQDKYVKDIAKENYLANPSNTHVQMIWGDTPDGQSTPDNYKIRITQEPGSAFIYGHNIFEGAIKNATDLNTIRFKVPRCEELTDMDIVFLEGIYGGTLLNPDGFRNAVSENGFGSSNPGSTSFVSSETALASFPEFNIFRFRSIQDADDTNLISQYTPPVVTPFERPTSGKCITADGVCYNYADTDMSQLSIGKRLCEEPDPNQGGLNGAWTTSETCSTEQVMRVCEGTMDLGGTEHDFSARYYDDAVFFTSLANRAPCQIYSGTVTPEIGNANCSNTNQGEGHCMEYRDLTPSLFGTYKMVCESSDAYNGTWNTGVCSTASRQGLCTYTTDFGSLTATIYQSIYTSYGSSGETYCTVGLNGIWVAD